MDNHQAHLLNQPLEVIQPPINNIINSTTNSTMELPVVILGLLVDILERGQQVPQGSEVEAALLQPHPEQKVTNEHPMMMICLLIKETDSSSCFG